MCEDPAGRFGLKFDLKVLQDYLVSFALKAPPLWMVSSIGSPHRPSPPYRGTSITRNSAPLGPYSRNVPRALWRPYGGGAVSYERGIPVRSQMSWCTLQMSGSYTPGIKFIYFQHLIHVPFTQEGCIAKTVPRGESKPAPSILPAT